MAEEKIIGIDLGTTNSVVAVMEGNEVKVIPNQEGNRLTPSVVAFTDKGDRLVADPAKRQAITNPRRTVYSIKRFMGRRHKEVLGEEKLVPYKIVGGPDDPAMVDIDGKNTVGDVLSLLNGLAPGKLSAAIGSDNVSLVLLDSSGGPNTFTITDLNSSLAGLPGSGLGIYGSDDTPDDNGAREIDGAPLHGDTLTNHLFFLKDATHTPSLTGTFALSKALGWDYLEKLSKQGVQQLQSTTATPKSIASGERALPLKLHSTRRVPSRPNRSKRLSN